MSGQMAPPSTTGPISALWWQLGYLTLVGTPSSNNVAEIVALHSWQHEDIHIHTDSKLVLGLFNGGLLSLENSRWLPMLWVMFGVSSPPLSHSNLLQYLLYLVHSHQGSLEVTWTKAHANNVFNNKADTLAKAALSGDRTVDVSEFHVPCGWVDTAPMISSKSLKFITEHVVKDTTPPPFSDIRCAPFLLQWSDRIYALFGQCLDAGLHGPNLWTSNIPTGL